MDTPLGFGAGSLTQEIQWASSGEWSLTERISYRGLDGDQSFTTSRGDPSQFAAQYAIMIAAIHGADPGRALFIDSLFSGRDEPCGVTRTRITFLVHDDPRDDDISWTQCATGDLHDVTPVGAGPDVGAARIVEVVTRYVRDEVFGPRWDYAYVGSVPFGTLARGENSRAALPAPVVISTQQGWTGFWEDQVGSGPPPTVDFATEVVVVAAVGERAEAGDSVEVARIVQVDFGTQIELVERRPGNFCSPVARRHTPFHVVVAPRTPEPARFAEVQVRLVPCGG